MKERLFDRYATAFPGRGLFPYSYLLLGALFCGIAAGVSLRNLLNAENLQIFSASVRDVFIYGESYSVTGCLAQAFLPFVLVCGSGFFLFGREAIPLVWFCLGLWKSFCVCSYIRAFGSIGCLYALAVFGLSDLVLIPGLLTLSCKAAAFSAAIFALCRKRDALCDIGQAAGDMAAFLPIPALSGAISFIAVPILARLL